jgi:hypothetical protein
VRVPETLALAEWRRGRISAEIKALSVQGGTSRTLSLEGWSGISGIDWARDGRRFWVSAIDPVGTQALSNVDLHGGAKLLLQDMQRGHFLTGRAPYRLLASRRRSTAWLLQGFDSATPSNPYLDWHS